MWHDAVVSEQAYSDASRPASELLRALGEATAGDPALSYDANAQASLNATLALRNALPLIADVVEAAERVEPLVTHVESPFPGLSAALVALREALEALDAES